MIVNINQCASTYDETLHAMKFSAIASQVVVCSGCFFCLFDLLFANCSKYVCIFLLRQLVQAPPVKMNLPTIQSLIKESSILANRSYTDDEDAADASDEESETDTDITMFNREVCCRQAFL